MRRIQIAILALFFIQGTTQAAPVLKVSLDAKQVLVQESFTWKLEVEGSEEMPSIRFPKIDKVTMISGPMQSSNYSYVNGKMSSTKTLTYTFAALEPGKVTFPQMEVFLGKKSYRTQPLELEIVAARTGSAAKGGPEPTVFLRALPSKQNIFLGEPLTVQYKLFTKVGVYNYQVDKLPDAVGFWAEEIPQSSQPRLVSEVIDGVRYNTAVLKTVLYYPTRSGELIIDALTTELEIEVKAKQNRRRVFNDPFFNDPFFRGTQRATRTFSSNQLKINVKDLPEPKPKNFSGAVGKFQLKAQLDTNAVLANDAVGLTVKLSGSGNFKSIQVPGPKMPEGVDVFKPERTENVSIKNRRHQGFKQSTHLLVPREPGNLVIDPIEFTYYDLQAGRYVTKSSGWIKLSVYDASGSQPVVTSGYSREEVTLMQDDIRYIKAAGGKMRSSKGSGFGLGFWSVHMAGVLLVILVYLYERKQALLRGNKALDRSSKAMRIAKQQLKQARKLSDSDNELQPLLHRTILGFIGARLGLAENAMESLALIQALEARELPEDLVKRTADFLDSLTMDRFAPGAVVRSQQELIESSETLLQDLGRSL